MNPPLDDTIDKKLDRLYELLPAVYRMRDADQHYPLRALLRVIAEQANVVEDNIKQLYDNWFIETCEDWVVPYIGDLVGYKQVHEAGEPGDVTTSEGRQLDKILISRRDVAETIHNRRRKGTLALLEELAHDVAGWPALAVEFYELLAWTQNINHLHLHRAKTIDLRDGHALERLETAFDKQARSVDVRRITSARTQGRHNIPSVGVFVWRLKSYTVSRTQAFRLDEKPDCYTFSILGNDAPLFTLPQSGLTSNTVLHESSVPAPIRRRTFEDDKDSYYGDGKSLQIWVGTSPGEPAPAKNIIPTDLTGWHYQPQGDDIALDPVLGRLRFSQGRPDDDQDVWVSYCYGFSADIGGGEYVRLLSQPEQAKIYRVGTGKNDHQTINEALNEWQHDHPSDAVIEIAESGLYEESLRIHLGKDQTLQLRAASAARPVISLIETRARKDAFFISGEQGSRFVMDGLMIVGRSVSIQGMKSQQIDRRPDNPGEGTGDLCEVIIRHCTLVPGWSIDCNCGDPCHGEKPSIELDNTTARIKIEHSIIGSIEITSDQERFNPISICISDSIVDSTGSKVHAISDAEDGFAYANLKIIRSTVFGTILSHQLTLAENSIFRDRVCIARTQVGCVRFSYVLPGSRTPRRYECQPDLVVQAVKNDETISDKNEAILSEQDRLRPQFNSVRYGKPTYGQLAFSCADEILRGADDESEMGVFHDLFQPQRATNLRARLDEYSPAGTDAGIIFIS